ncbi:hypothetical protein HJC99_05885 [Candidatus Saccharibacteria bacterium]|nr:hypothetical protein [Candidatus Saccharibacteria bacterium]
MFRLIRNWFAPVVTVALIVGVLFVLNDYTESRHGMTIWPEIGIMAALVGLLYVIRLAGRQLLRHLSLIIEAIVRPPVERSARRRP